MAEDDIFLSMGGGSLLNDLLSDLDAAITANELVTDKDDPTDDLFASLKNDLVPPKGPPGLMSSAGAFVVSRQAPVDITSTSVNEGNVEQDAWSAALAQFGGMSLAQEFLAADTAKKQQSQPMKVVPESEVAKNVVDMVFEDEYALDEEAKIKHMVGEEEVDATGGLMALLGASRAKTQQNKEVVKNTPKKEEVMIQSPQPTGTKAPPPSPMFPPNMNMPPPPPGAMMHPPPPHPPMMFPGPPPPHMMPPPGAMMPPPHLMHMGGGPGMPPLPSPHVMGPPPPPMMPPNYGSKPAGPGAPPPPPASNQTNQDMFKTKDFPALGATPQEIEESKAQEEEEEARQQQLPAAAETPSVRAHIVFNNPDPSAAPINANLVSSALMPARDITFVVNAMMRPLASLDAYNDDYYHWSYVDRKSRNMLSFGMSNNLALPEPVWKEVKVEAQERESKFRESLDLRSKEFAEEKKSLGRLVKTNVNRPKALLVTPALKKDDNDVNPEEIEKNHSSDYESEQKRLRIQAWRARVAIDKGYTAFLTLTELRRLIQANAGATQLIHELTGDVKANVNLMHASFGVVIKNEEKGNRKIEVDQSRFESTLSMPKGRTLFARVIEGGILPHQSACELFPVALASIFKTALPAAEGEERLLRALMGLVLTVQPSIEPGILSRCLDVAIAVGKNDGSLDAKTQIQNITGSRTRMELLHAILSRGRAVCGDDTMLGWAGKEKQFTALLA